MSIIRAFKWLFFAGQAFNLEADWRMKVEHFIGGKYKDNRLGFSWNFKVLKWINLNESFRHCYKHHEDYVMRFKKNSVEPNSFRDNTEKC